MKLSDDCTLFFQNSIYQVNEGPRTGLFIFDISDKSRWASNNEASISYSAYHDSGITDFQVTKANDFAFATFSVLSVIAISLADKSQWSPRKPFNLEKNTANWELENYNSMILCCNDQFLIVNIGTLIFFDIRNKSSWGNQPPNHPKKFLPVNINTNGAMQIGISR